MLLSKPRIEHGTFTVTYCNANHPTAKCSPWFTMAPYESIKKDKLCDIPWAFRPRSCSNPTRLNVEIREVTQQRRSEWSVTVTNFKRPFRHELFQTQYLTRRNTSHLRYKYQSTNNSEDVVTRITTHINPQVAGEMSSYCTIIEK